MRILVIFLTLTGLSGLPSESTVMAEATQEQIQAATDSGQIIPLSDILRAVRNEVPGKVLDVQVDNDKSPWQYRIKVRGNKGDVTLVTVNAETGEIISIKGQR